MRNSPLHRSEPKSPPAATRSKWKLRLLLLVVAPTVFLLGLEGVLRVAGYGYPTASFVSREVNRQPAWVDNGQFGWRFSLAHWRARLIRWSWQNKGPPIRSAFSCWASPPRWESPLLITDFPECSKCCCARFPDRNFEAINVAMVAIDSNVILPLARKCAQREGDLWVVYMGNNEMAGPFGVHAIFGTAAPPRPFIRASLAFNETRFGQLLNAGLKQLREATSPPTNGKG